MAKPELQSAEEERTEPVHNAAEDAAEDAAAEESTEPVDNAEEEDGEAANVTPEEDAQYALLADACLTQLEDGMKDVVNQVKAAQDPVVGAGFSVAMIVKSIVDGFAQGVGGVQPQEFDDDMIIQAGQEVVATLVEHLDALGILKADKETITAVSMQAVKIYGDKELEKGITPEVRAQAQQYIEQARSKSRNQPGPGSFVGKAMEAVNA